jgi:hypothetical protein
MISLKNTHYHFAIRSIYLILLSLITTSCTHVSQLPTDKISLLPTQNKIDLKVKLITGSAFLNKNYSTQIGSDTYTVQMGANLEEYSKQLVRNVFINPLVNNNADYNGGDLFVLTPSIKSLVLVRGGSAWDEQWMTVVVEWRLNDKKGNLKWIKNIIGKVKTVSWSGYDTSLPLFTSLSIKDAFEKSQDAMLSSKVLRKLQQTSK